MTATPPPARRRQRAVVGGLVLVLALIGGAVVGQGLSSGGSRPSPVAETPEIPSPTAVRPLREGVVGEAALVNPLLAVSRTDRQLVGLVFSGLVRLGPGETVVPDLAREWAVSDDGRIWTFTLRDGATWHDGTPVTARDVTFTVGILRDPAWTGPGAATWRDVTASAVDERTVRFELATPLGGFLQAATQPLLPAHLLEQVPVADLADHPFNRAPVGSGPYRLASLDADRVRLVAVAAEVDPAASASTSPDPADPASTLPPAGPAGPTRPPEIELRFYPDAAALAAAFEADDLDVAAGLPAADALRLSATPETHLLRYPTSTLTAVIFNLRPNQPELRDARVRVSLLRAIDRPALVAEAWGGEAEVADAPIQRVSWAFDGTASPRVRYDPAGARRSLVDAGWRVVDGRLVAPKASKPYTFELLSADAATNAAAAAAAASIAADWDAFGMSATPRALPADELITKRLRTADFAAAVVDVNVGLDPDLYPLLGSTQGTSRGLNLSGLVDAELDKRLIAARAPGTDEQRRAAYRALQLRLAERQYVLPIAFHDELVVARDTLSGASPRQIGSPGDRYWDVLSWRLADGR